MNGIRLTERDLDLNIATRALAPRVTTYPPVPEATEPPHIGRGFKQPAPPRMYDEERTSPWLIALYLVGLVLGAFGPTLWASVLGAWLGGKLP